MLKAAERTWDEQLRRTNTATHLDPRKHGIISMAELHGAADCLNDLIAYLSRMNVARNTAALTALHVDSDATQSSSHDWTEGG